MMTLESLWLSELYAIPFLFVSGSIFHFLYKWSKYDKRVAIFGAVNESLWEHMKIAFWPMFFWTMIQYILWMNVLLDKFLLVKTISLLLITISIPSLVYAYTRILRKYVFFIDLPLFFVCISISQIVSYFLIKDVSFPHWMEHVSVIPLFLLVIAYSTFTPNPPRFDLFRDPTNKKYEFDATNKDPNKKAEFITPID